MMVVKVLAFLIASTIAKRHHKDGNVYRSNKDFFGNIYVAIHTAMDNLFESIDITSDYIKKPSTKLLLTMHTDLSNIANKNYDAFYDIQNNIKVNISNETKDKVELYTVVKEVLNEKQFDVYHLLKGSKPKHAKAKAKERHKDTEVTINSDFDDSEEFKAFVVKFFEKINNITIGDSDKSSKHGRYAVSSKKNIKAWKPPTYQELDLLKSTFTRRVYRGFKTHVSIFPFVVSIHILGEFSCTGSIIKRGFIITAASCLQIAYQNDYFKNNLKSIYVRLGSDHTTRGGETIPIEDLYFHPEYEPKYSLNNIVILKLEKRNRYSRQQMRIRRILWDKSPENLRNDTKGVLVLGWGAKNKNLTSQKHPKLTMDMLSFYDTDDCKKKYSEDLITKEHFCAGFKNVSGGACDGDIGGPGIVGAVLMGVVSFGAPVYGMGHAPTVFTKLGYYAPWIESILNQDNKGDHTITLGNYTRRKYDHNIFKFNNMSTFKNNKLPGPRTKTRGQDLPKEIKTLRDVLLDLTRADNKIIDDIVYGELNEEFNKIYKSTEQTDMKDHIYSHANRTKVLTRRTIKTKLITTTYHTKDLKHSYIDRKTTPSRNQPLSNSDDDTDDGRNDYTDNYEQSSEELPGMSIEIENPKRTNNLIVDRRENVNQKNKLSEETKDDISLRISDKSSEDSSQHEKQESTAQKDSSSDESLSKPTTKFNGTGFGIDEKYVTPFYIDFGKGNKKKISKIVPANDKRDKHASSVIQEIKPLETNCTSKAKRYIRKSTTRNSMKIKVPTLAIAEKLRFKLRK